jgi:aminoglycoside phosphotransferase (APT) family kinase protein
VSRDNRTILDALRAYLPGGAAIEAVVPLTTGFSNETYRIEGRDWILRLPPAAGAMLEGHDVIAQARLYRGLGEVDGGPPVPAIVAICEDAGVLGAPFFVMECIAGEPVHDTALQDWFTGPDDAFRSRLASGWVSAIGSFARLQPLADLGDPVSPEDDARMWQAFAAKAGCSELVEAFDRLLAVPAPRSGPSAIIHGDVKLSNFMWHDERLSAVLDWEMALNGDPLADLAYALLWVESPHHVAVTPHRQPGMLDRAGIIAAWEATSGRSADGVGWHEIAQMGKTNAIIAEGTAMFTSGRSADPKLAYFQKNLDYYLGAMNAMLDAEGL